jgi:hypothetical protein
MNLEQYDIYMERLYSINHEIRIPVYSLYDTLKLGFKATTLGKMPNEFLDSTRFERIAIGHKIGNSFYDAKLRCYSYMGLSPYYQIVSTLRYIKHLANK